MDNKDMNETDVQEALGTLDQTLNKSIVRQVVQDLNAAIQEVVKKHGLCVTSACSSRYTDILMKVNFEIGVRRHEGLSASHQQFILYSAKFRYPHEWFGQEVIINGRTYTITGVNPRKPKNCIQLTRKSDGRIFKTTVNQIQRARGGR